MPQPGRPDASPRTTIAKTRLALAGRAPLLDRVLDEIASAWTHASPSSLPSLLYTVHGFAYKFARG